MQMDPDVEFPFLYVATELRGASPETVEREVTDVLEESINALEGIHTISSVSSQGLSRIAVEFGLRYDVDVKAQEVRDKVALARPLLPLDVENPVVQKFDLGAISPLTVVLGGTVSIRELSDLAEHQIKERLERLPGVGGVTLLGARAREIGSGSTRSARGLRPLGGGGREHAAPRERRAGERPHRGRSADGRSRRRARCDASRISESW
jgi:HAE1 family hydrophobic/amphiphilic exporter-1